MSRVEAEPLLRGPPGAGRPPRLPAPLLHHEAPGEEAQVAAEVQVEFGAGGGQAEQQGLRRRRPLPRQRPPAPGAAAITSQGGRQQVDLLQHHSLRDHHFQLRSASCRREGERLRRSHPRGPVPRPDGAAGGLRPASPRPPPSRPLGDAPSCRGEDSPALGFQRRYSCTGNCEQAAETMEPAEERDLFLSLSLYIYIHAYIRDKNVQGREE